MNPKAKRLFEGNSTIKVVSKYPAYILEDLNQKIKKRHSLKSEDTIYVGLEEYFENKTINKVSEIEFERDLLGMTLRGDVLIDPRDVIEIADKWYRRINNDNNQQAEYKFFRYNSLDMANRIAKDIYAMELTMSSLENRKKFVDSLTEYLKSIKVEMDSISDFNVCLLSSIMECNIKVNPRDLIQKSYTWYAMLQNTK